MKQPSASISAFNELEQTLDRVLESYSNVHRGSGHLSQATTALYEEARVQVLRYLDLSLRKFAVLFSSPYGAAQIIGQLEGRSVKLLSSEDFGIPLGVRILVVRKQDLPSGPPSLSGGGTTKMISHKWISWADGPDKFEAGTPAVVNVLLFVKVLQLVKRFGKRILTELEDATLKAIDLSTERTFEGLTGTALLDRIKQTLVGQTLEIPTSHGPVPFVNLDNSASTPTFSPILKSYKKALRLRASERDAVPGWVRGIVSTYLKAPDSEFDIHFTSNTTSAVNLVSEHILIDQEKGTNSTVLNTLLEHSSNDLPWRLNRKLKHLQLDVDKEGFFNLRELEEKLDAYNLKKLHGSERIGLVTLSGASNVLGVCNDLEEASGIVHKYGAILMVDAAQLVAHKPIDVQTANIDLLVFSGHKVYAPFGCGVLVARKGLLRSDADAQKTWSMEEENTAGIAALGASLQLMQRIGLDVVEQEEQRLNKKLLKGLLDIPGLQVYGIRDPEHQHLDKKLGVALFQFKGKAPGGTAKKLASTGGVGVRYGCHCAHLIVKHVLDIGPGIERIQRVVLKLFPKLKFQGLVRASLGMQSTDEDVDRLIKTLNRLATKNINKSDIKTTSKEIARFIDKRIEMVFGEH